MTVTATIRQRPEDGAKNVDGLEVDWIIETHDDYDQAVAALQARVPDGWQIIALRTG